MTKSISEQPIIFVAGILEKVEDGVRKVFLQTRWKPEISPKYSGLFEIPGGRVDNYENIFDAIQREVMEECGLKIVTFQNSSREELSEVSSNEQTMVFEPFICQQVLTKDDGKLWFGFVFICEVEGEAKMQEGETKNPQWVSIEDLRRLLDEQPEKIFPYQYQILRRYVDHVNNSQ